MATEDGNLPGRLQWAFEQSGHTQASLAREIGISKGAIGQWATGKTDHIRPAHLFDAARALRVEPEWLGNGKGPRTRLERAAPEVDVEICRLVSALPDAAKTALLALCVSLMRRAAP
ncbi:MAG: helix-turn-helix domain-containing protein [Bradyrhizobium sp.]|uniref:helix-turn-helix domain-containing protein n=1 Tax=Bradyrhizobium sp. TaxID=376 RepID=UPI003D0DB627